MSGVTVLCWVLAGIAIFMFFVAVVTFIVYKLSSRKVQKLTNVYLGRLENSDASIQEAVQYLKLTNSITESNEEQAIYE